MSFKSQVLQQAKAELWDLVAAGNNFHASMFNVAFYFSTVTGIDFEELAWELERCNK